MGEHRIYLFYCHKNGSNERKYQVCINKTFAKRNENKIM